MSAPSRSIDPADSAVRARDDQALSQELLAQAGQLIVRDEKGLLAFFQALYRNATPEDVNRLDSPSLFALARLVDARARRHRKGQCLVEIFSARDEAAEYAHIEDVLVAVNDDMPFLFDSLLAEVAAHNVRTRAVFHPILTLGDAPTSVIVLVLDPIVEPRLRDRLIEDARSMFAQVRLAVRDWQKMTHKLKESIAELRRNPPLASAEEIDESLAFLEWLDADHFTFLGCRDYRFSSTNGGSLEPEALSGLGVLSDIEARVVRRGPDRSRLTPQVRAFLTEPSPLVITKSNERSRIHRRVHMDYVGVKIFGDDGTLKGERRFVGLFTSSAYSRRPGDIPLVRRKITGVLSRAGLPTASHDGKALAHILDTYPRDELFQISDDDLFATAMGILQLGERPKVKLFVRFDRFDRFVSVLAFVPRDRYDSRVREAIHAILARAFDGRMSSSTPTVADSPLARVHYIIGRNDGHRPFVDIRVLEAEVRAAIRTWGDEFLATLIGAHGETEGRRLFLEASRAFSEGYRSVFSPGEAVQDFSELVKLRHSKDGFHLRVRAYQKQNDARSSLRLKVFGLGHALPLSASVPVFENFGLRVIAEDSFPVSLVTDGWARDAIILDFLMERADEGPILLSDIREKFEAALYAVLSGAAENDGFNRLVLAADLSWRDTTILRACAKFLRQAGIAFSQDYMERALWRNPDIAGTLVELFHVSHDPKLGAESAVAATRTKIDVALNDVPSLDDDRIVRRIRNVIECVLRTNFYQRDQEHSSKAWLSVKLDSGKLEELPLPRPMVEVFVYSPMVEGIHLRFGRIARGGIRWSDRREDFRTEILGLAKAQQVKNAIIVPVGAKGGFYPKQLPVNATREAVQQAGIEAYKILIEGLLDITDNVQHDGSIARPSGTRCYDGDDPYLVVAADKGTATFSDIANAIAENRGFWLGDAFASGGSHGYDHKKMGITARGAWEAVKRHFHEMGRDVAREPFTCIGIGDMSGDVFGNGMLLSRQTRLIAAFDHRHIFFDPDPNPETSWTERKRLFELPRSSWADYSQEHISRGGGIFDRAAKEIVVSEPLKALTGLAAPKATPSEVIHALLKTDVDLLFFGGIGTFIKATTQTHAEVGDRTNDAVRVNAAEVRAKVIAEGANLGVTQAARVEYARAGGRINTDAVDNSAGVDTSDHEVNLKILLSAPYRRGEFHPDDRDALLKSVADDIAAHVLRNNYDQTLALSVALRRAHKDLDAHARYMRDLEARGRLDRSVEVLPDDSELRLRAQREQGLTRPELAVLGAYAKLDLDADLEASPLPDEPAFESVLSGYFPGRVVERFPAELKQHRLRREIISNLLSNRLVNLAGPVFIARMKEMSGAPGYVATRAFVIADGAFALEALKARIDALDGRVSADVQNEMHEAIAEILRRLGLWFITNTAFDADLAATIALYRAGAEELRGTFSSLVSPYEARETEARIESLRSSGVPLDVAEDIAILPLMAGMPDIAALAHAQGLSIDLVAGAFFATGAITGIDRMRGLADKIQSGEHWDRLALRRIVDDLFAGQRALTANALKFLDLSRSPRKRSDGADAAAKWAETNHDALARARSFLAALERAGEPSIAKLTLANSQVRQLAT